MIPPRATQAECILLVAGIQDRDTFDRNFAASGSGFVATLGFLDNCFRYEQLKPFSPLPPLARDLLMGGDNQIPARLRS